MGCLPKKNEWYSVNHFVAVACATTITTPLKRHNTFEPEEWLQPPKCAKISSSFEEYSSSSNRNSLETDHDIDEWIKPEKVSSPFQVSTSSCSTTSCYNSFEALASENIENTKKRPRKLPSGASSDDFSFSADEFACSSPIPQNYSSFENVLARNLITLRDRKSPEDTHHPHHILKTRQCIQMLDLVHLYSSQL
ncbi:hypothetical protein SNE40_005912 [Patella caerulea]|uniref:Uncharacterized protein n=1 Tax=Patella caerulea TaxID=87958 RepID=A0AAN8K6Y9_PATCE